MQPLVLSALDRGLNIPLSCSCLCQIKRFTVINLNNLRAFAAIADAGSVTRAAAALAISQPAASKHLSDLEQSLNLLLCERLPRGIRLTEAGRILHDYARQLLAIEAAAEADMAALATGERGRLSVGASTTIGSYLVPELFGAYRREHPGVELELKIGNTEAIQDALLEGSIELALTEGFVHSKALDVEIVAHDEMKVIVAPDHPWTERRRVRVADLARVPCIMRERGSGTRAVIEAALAERGVGLDPTMSLGSTEAIKNAVAAGLGIGIVSELTVGLELASGRLVGIDIEGFTIRRALHLLKLEGRRPSPAANTFSSLLRRWW